MGDVKVQAGEAFEHFKNRVSNVKNKTVAAGAEALSNKVRNFNDAMETGRQNVQNMMDSIGNQRQPAFALAGDGNVNLPKSNVSTKIDDFADRIQQISVDHKQKIAAFEGRGGGSVDPKVKVEDDILVEPYKTLRRNREISGQAHHLNQNAAFRDVIPRKEGLSVKLEGNIRKDIGSPHYRAHESLEEFWDQYRRNGEFYLERPTIAEYNVALEKSLVDAGLTPKQAQRVVEKAIEQQTFYGLTSEEFVPRIPRKIYLPK